jgi:hypothetical protein
MALFGNIVTSWSWFGTNMLGVGLHSYGFMDSAVFWLALWIGTNLALIAFGCMRAPFGRSSKRELHDMRPGARAALGT